MVSNQTPIDFTSYVNSPGYECILQGGWNSRNEVSTLPETYKISEKVDSGHPSVLCLKIKKLFFKCMNKIIQD